MKKDYFEPTFYLLELGEQDVVMLSGAPSDLGGDTEYVDPFGGKW